MMSPPGGSSRVPWGRTRSPSRTDHHPSSTPAIARSDSRPKSWVRGRGRKSSVQDSDTAHSVPDSDNEDVSSGVTLPARRDKGWGGGAHGGVDTRPLHANT